MDVSAVWCVFFKRKGVLSGLKYRSLKHAYRAPSLFLSKMRDAGHGVYLLTCDEELTLTDFSSRRIHESAGIFYITTHGLFGSSGYRACLHRTDWQPAATGLGGASTAVAVFDTCYLIDSAQNWKATWAAANPGLSLRLMLGFDNLAGLDRGNALRGKAFADNLLNGQTFVDAWFAAVSATTARYNKAIAIAIGDTKTDALNVLNNASLSSMPGPRAGTGLYFELRP
jgi:hypothetical protein